MYVMDPWRVALSNNFPRSDLAPAEALSLCQET